MQDPTAKPDAAAFAALCWSALKGLDEAERETAVDALAAHAQAAPVAAAAPAPPRAVGVAWVLCAALADDAVSVRLAAVRCAAAARLLSLLDLALSDAAEAVRVAAAVAAATVAASPASAVDTALRPACTLLRAADLGLSTADGGSEGASASEAAAVQAVGALARLIGAEAARRGAAWPAFVAAAPLARVLGCGRGPARLAAAKAVRDLGDAVLLGEVQRDVKCLHAACVARVCVARVQRVWRVSASSIPAPNPPNSHLALALALSPYPSPFTLSLYLSPTLPLALPGTPPPSSPPSRHPHSCLGGTLRRGRGSTHARGDATRRDWRGTAARTRRLARP